MNKWISCCIEDVYFKLSNRSTICWVRLSPSYDNVSWCLSDDYLIHLSRNRCDKIWSCGTCNWARPIDIIRNYLERISLPKRKPSDCLIRVHRIWLVYPSVDACTLIPHNSVVCDGWKSKIWVERESCPTKVNRWSSHSGSCKTCHRASGSCLSVNSKRVGIRDDWPANWIESLNLSFKSVAWRVLQNSSDVLHLKCAGEWCRQRA